MGGSGNIEFEMTYVLTQLVVVLVLCATLGMVPAREAEHFNGALLTEFLASELQEKPGSVLLSVLAGAVLCIGDFVMACAIDLLGVTIACPIGFSIPLIFGSSITYIIEPKADPVLLFPGVVLNLCGMLFDTASHAKMIEREPESAGNEPSACITAAGPQDSKPAESAIGNTFDEKSKDSPRNWTLLLVPLLGGICLAASVPICTVAGSLGDLDPYIITCAFMVGQLLALLPMLTVYVMLVKPESFMVSGCIPSVILAHFLESLRKAPRSSFWNAMAGVCTGSGWWLFLVGSPVVSRAVAFSIGCSGTLTSIFYGVVIFGEFRGQPCQANLYCGVATCFFLTAIVLMTIASV
jgi:glucose uptake protein GlcU